MAQSFKETAHLNIDHDAYREGWERIFGKKTNQSQTQEDPASLESLPDTSEEDPFCEVDALCLDVYLHDKQEQEKAKSLEQMMKT